ncbi:MAG: phosphatidate cytidylyltransferase [bacterium]
MKQRTITGAILFLILAPLIAIEILTIPFQVVMGGFVICAALELLKMYESEKKYSIPVKLMIVLCSLLIYGSIIFVIYTGVDGYNFTIVFSAMLINMIILMVMSVFGDFDGKDIVKGAFTMLYAGMGISALVMLKAFNIDFIIYLFLITTMTDMFAYFGGVLFGKHKMAPTISPKKTWEGAVIGSIFGTAAASSFALFLGINNSSIFSEILSFDGALLIAFVICLTAVATILGQIGDLVASKLKRTYEIKDFGKIFPGHGGVLDRFDSAIFVSMFLLAAIILIV